MLAAVSMEDKSENGGKLQSITGDLVAMEQWNVGERVVATRAYRPGDSLVEVLRVQPRTPALSKHAIRIKNFEETGSVGERNSSRRL